MCPALSIMHPQHCETATSGTRLASASIILCFIRVQCDVFETEVLIAAHDQVVVSIVEGG